MKKHINPASSDSYNRKAYTGPLPEVGDPAPAFAVHTQKGIVRFPAYSKGCWCIFFAHPANFTSAWTMYSTFLSLKERWFNSRNTKLIALSNERLQRQSDWSEKVRRYIGIYLGAPVIEDLDFSIASRYGMATGRRKQNDNNRVAFIIDPEGIIRLIVDDQQPSIDHAILNLEQELDRLQGKVTTPSVHEVNMSKRSNESAIVFDVPEQCDATPNYKLKPAYFKKDKINPN
jgi:alkyl hydroperoxide reductase subunit AhpC